MLKGAAIVHPGQVLAVGYSAQTPDGFLGKVVKVTHQGASEVVQTTPAALAQAVGNGNLDLATLTRVSGAAAIGNIRAHVAGASLFNPNLVNAISCSGGAAISVTPAVSVSVTPSLRASFSFFGGLTSASFSLNGTATASLTLQDSGNASCTLPSTALLLKPVRISTFAGLVGGVPVVVVLQGQVYADANIAATDALTTDVSASASITGGVSYSHGKFSPIFTGGQSFQFHAPTVSATGTAQADIEPALQMLLYGVAGPQLGVKAGLAFSASSTADPWWTLDGPVSVEASLVAPVLGLDSPNLTLYSHTFPLMAPPGEPTSVTATPRDASADISWQPPPVSQNLPLDSCACHALNGYTVYLDGTAVATTSGATSTTLTGLTNGVSYQVAVASESSAGFPFESLQTAPVTVTPTASSIPVGNAPDAVSSDGTHVWVANDFYPANGTVTEIDAATGGIIRTIPIPVGVDPYGVSSDGTRVWVANGSGTVTEIDAATGAVVRTITLPAGSNPHGVSSDGTHVWVNNVGSVSEIDAATGAVLGTNTTIGGFAISSDGTQVWATNFPSGTLSEIDAASGAVVRTIPFSTVGGASAVSSDGAHVWVVDGDGTVTELDAATGGAVRTIALSSSGIPNNVSSDGTDVWVTEIANGPGNGTVTEIDAATGAIVDTIPVGNYPLGLSSDGTHVWVANAIDDTVSEIQIGSAP